MEWLVTDPATTYRLVRPPLTGEPPVLDEQQQRVVDHAGGPLLVLAGPGTGKTTTLVEAIVAPHRGPGTHPDRILALTFSRKAAEQLRDRVTARVGRTMSASIGSTFHSFAYGLIRRYAPAELYVGPLRLLSAPEQDVVLRELLQDHPESVTLARRAPARARHPRVRARGPRGAVPRPGEGPRRRASSSGWARPTGCRSSWRPALFLEQYLDDPRRPGAVDYADLIRRATIEATVHRDELRAAATRTSSSTSTRTPTPARSRCCARSPATAATWSWSATRTSRSTRSGAPRCAASSTSRPTSRAPTARPADVVALRHHPPVRAAAAHRRPAGRRPDRAARHDPREAREAFLAPAAEAGEHGEGRVVVRTFDSDRAEAEHLADLLRRAHLEDGVAWDEMAVLVRSGRQSIPPLRRSLGAAGVPVEVASDEVPLVRDPAALPLHRRAAGGAQPRQRRPRPRRPHRRRPGRGAADRPARRPRRRRRTPPGPAAARPREGRRRTAERAAAGARRASWSAAPCSTRGCLDGLDGPRGRPGPGGGRRSSRAPRGQLDAGATAEELLWTLWSGTALAAPAAPLGRARRRRSPPGAPRPRLDLRAVRRRPPRAEETRDHVGVREFLATLVAQQIPADTLAERGARGAAVRLLTAHRAKGLEWRLVVVAHVQQDGWPDLRRRSTLLRRRPDRHRRAGPADLRARAADGGAPALLRRLHPRPRAARRHRGRLGRRRRRPAVPVPRRARRHGRGGRGPAASDRCRWPGLVSELRRTARRPGDDRRRCARPPRVGWPGWRPRRSATARSCRWPTRRPGGAPARRAGRSSRSATPTSRCRCRPACSSRSRSARPSGSSRARPAASPAPTSPPTSASWCTRSPSGSPPASSSRPDGVDALMEHVDAVWDRLEFRTPWAKAREHERVRAALARSSPGTTPTPARWSASRQQFRAVARPRPTASRCSSTGYADRLELDADGRVVVVDLKTGRTKPTDKSVRAQRPARPLPATPSTTAPSTSSPGARPRPRPAAPSSSSSGSPTAGPTRSSSTRPARPTTAPSATALRARLGAGGRAAARRDSSRRSPATTAATAPSCRSARSRAPGRWSPSDQPCDRLAPRRPRRG